MRKVVLKDNTKITNCTDSTTTNEIIVLRDTYAEAGAILDTVTPESASVIKVYDEKNELVAEGADLVLIDGGKLDKVENGVTVTFTTRVKTQTEKMQDEIEELQEAIIG